MAACLRALRVATSDQAQEVLETDPALLPVALEALLLGVTGFFRDPSVFAQIERWTPELAGANRKLRVWSAACSDGRELYSIALTLAELDLLDGSLLVGTDCRTGAIQKAQAGRYTAAELKDLKPSLRGRWFRRLDDGSGDFQVDSRLRSPVRWEVEDVLSRTRPGPWDVVLWRNHAIYLRPEVTTRVWHRLTDQLKPGGLLVTGRAERPDRSLPLARIAGCIYRKR